MQIGNPTAYLGDCMEIMPTLARADVAIVDPPYGDTSLDWDTLHDKWAALVPADQFWCWGSLRFFCSAKFPGFKMAQDIVWEKHNGSGSAADRPNLSLLAAAGAEITGHATFGTGRCRVFSPFLLPTAG